MHWHVHHDGARHFRAYQRRNERMPLAIALGRDVSGQPLVADLGIAVVGEMPYAEGVGDRESLSLRDADKALIKSMRERSKKLVVVTNSEWSYTRAMLRARSHCSAPKWSAPPAIPRTTIRSPSSCVPVMPAARSV